MVNYREEPVAVPWRALKPETLRRVIEEFVLREGTDYGEEHSLDQKIASVLEALKSGEATVVYDQVTETTSIVEC